MPQKFHFEGLKPGKSYQFQVVATSADGSLKSAPSNVIYFTASGDSTPPDPVTALGSDFSTNTFTASWNGAGSSSVADFLDYKVIITKPSSTSSQTFYTPNTAFAFSLEQNRNLFGITTPSPSVTVSVAARDTSGNLSSFLTSTAANPIPSNIASASSDFNSGDLYWKWDVPASSNDTDITGYKVSLFNTAAAKRVDFTVGGKDNSSFMLTFEQNTNNFSIPRPTFNASVSAIDIFGQLSATPLTATITNPAPTESPSVTANGIIQGFAASWTAPSSSFIDYSYTEVYYSTSSSFFASATAPAWRGTGTYAEFSQISSYVPYYIKARHFDVFGQAGPESTAASTTPLNPDGTDTTPPGTASINGASFNGSTLEVYFKRPVDSDLSSFRLNLYAASSTASPVIVQNADTTSSTTVQVFRLTLDQNSSYFGSPQSNISGNIYSRDYVGNTSSSFANFTGSAVFTAPSVTYNSTQWGSSASGLTAAALGYTVSWDDVSACPAFGYSRVYESTTGSTSGFSEVYQGQSNNVTINALANQRWVYVQHYTVFNNAGASAVPRSITPTNPVIVNTTAPSNATNLTVTASNDGGATGFSGHLVASWTQSSASNVRGYRLRVRQADETYYQYENAASNVTQYHIGGLVPGENYEVAIAAYDELNNTSSYTLASAYAVIPYSSSIAEVITISAASNSTNIAITGTTAASMVGMTILGYGITGGTIVTASATGSLTLSQPTFATISASAASLTYGVSNLSSYIVAGTSSYMKFGTGVKGTQSGLFIDDNNYWFNSGNLRVGSTTSSLRWDGTALWLSGNINAKGGSFSGPVQLGDGSLFAASVGGGSVVINSNGISASNSAGTNTFVLSGITGLIGASAGVIGGWTLSSTNLSSNNVNIDSTGSLTLGSTGTGSVVALSANDATYRIWAGNLTPTSANFRVDKYGTLYANAASVTGDITATNGYFVGDLTANTLSLTGNELIYGSIIAASAARITGATRTAAGSIVFALNVANPFAAGASVSIGGAARNIDGLYTASVDSSGSLVVYNAGTAGTVTTGSNAFAASYNSGPRVTMSSSGLYVYNSSNEQIVTLPTNTGAQAQISGWYINSGSLTAGTGATRVALSSGTTSGDIVFWAGSDTRTTASVRVTNTGYASFTNAYVSGSLLSTTGSVGGWSLTASGLYGGPLTTNNVVTSSFITPGISGSATLIALGDSVFLGLGASNTTNPIIYLNDVIDSGNYGTIAINSGGGQGTIDLYRRTEIASSTASILSIKYNATTSTASLFLATTPTSLGLKNGSIITLTGLSISPSYSFSSVSAVRRSFSTTTASVDAAYGASWASSNAASVVQGGDFIFFPSSNTGSGIYITSTPSITFIRDASSGSISSSIVVATISHSITASGGAGVTASFFSPSEIVIPPASIGTASYGDYAFFSGSIQRSFISAINYAAGTASIGTGSAGYATASFIKPSTMTFRRNPNFADWNFSTTNDYKSIISIDDSANYITISQYPVNASGMPFVTGSIALSTGSLTSGSIAISNSFSGRISNSPFYAQDGHILTFIHDKGIGAASNGWPTRAYQNVTGARSAVRIIQPNIMTRSGLGTIEMNGSWMDDGISQLILGDGLNNYGADLVSWYDTYVGSLISRISMYGNWSNYSSFWTGSSVKAGRIGMQFNVGQGPNGTTTTVKSVSGTSGNKYLTIAVASATYFTAGQEIVNTSNTAASGIGTLNQVESVVTGATTASIFLSYALTATLTGADVSVYTPDRRKLEFNSTGNIYMQSDEDITLQATRYFSGVNTTLSLLRNSQTIYMDAIEYQFGSGYFKSGIDIEPQTGWINTASPYIMITPFDNYGTRKTTNVLSYNDAEQAWMFGDKTSADKQQIKLKVESSGIGAGNAGILIGRRDSTSAFSYIDFYTSGGTKRDARIIASKGNTGTRELGQISINAASIQANGVPMAAVQAGSATFTGSYAANGGSFVPITFPVTFGTAPYITCSLRNALGGSNPLVPRALNSTTTGFNLYVYNTQATAIGAITVQVNWIAVDVQN